MENNLEFKIIIEDMIEETAEILFKIIDNYNIVAIYEKADSEFYLYFSDIREYTRFRYSIDNFRESFRKEKMTKQVALLTSIQQTLPHITPESQEKEIIVSQDAV